MTSNIKTAFDDIRAEDSLKENTLQYLQSEIQKRNGVRTRNHVRRFSISFASFAVILLSVVFSYNLYFTPAAYVDMDVNPSIELTLNRFDRVIDAYAYNEDGEVILTGLSLNHKNYNDALIILIDTINQNGYIQNNGLITVTLQATDTGKESQLLAYIKTGIDDYISDHHGTAQIDVFSVDRDTRIYAHKLNISSAKYLAIQELIEVDPTATVESCREHSISEIRQLTQAHGYHHGNGNAGSGDEPVTGDDGEGYEDHDNNVQDSGQGNGHHGETGGYHGGHD